MSPRPRKIALAAEGNGHVPVAPPEPDYRDVATPKTAEELAAVISKGVARALELASTSKDVTEAVKAATWWYRAQYGDGGGEPWGQGLGGGKGGPGGGR